MTGEELLERRLAPLRAGGGLRSLPGAPAGIDFWSNDYLGLAPAVRQRIAAAPATDPLHFSTGSRLIAGDHPDFSALEERIARYHGFPAALVFASGYAANSGLLSCLPRRTDTIVYDELIHASLRDGIRLSGATARRFRHNDLADLRDHCTRARADGAIFCVTESRFSMDGDRAPLTALAETCQELGAHLIVDEAHSTGLDGPIGSGLVAQLRLQGAVFASVATYGKAPGYHGAAVLGSPLLREYLVNFSRPFIYSTAPGPAYWAGLAATYDALADHHAERSAQLTGVIETYATALERAGLASHLTVRDGPIQTVHLPGNTRIMAAEARLRAAGLLVKGIRSPTVAAGSERLRICLHAFNTAEEVGRLIAELAKLQPA